MLFLRSWLEEYIDLSAFTNSQLKNLITMKSGEVDEVIEINDYFEGKILVGKIFNTQKHPDADRLQIFQVDLGVYGQIQIVSAAPNVRDGIVVPVAIVGTKLPMGTILERKMRGELSQGMCLGKSELMLETEYSEGLWELEDLLLESGLSENQYLGKSICEVLTGHFPKESVFDIKYLADKIASCGNHLGLAVDIAICLENKNLLKTQAKNLLDPVFLMEQVVSKVEIADEKDIKVNLESGSDYLKNYFLFDLEIPSEYILPHEFQKRMFLTNRNQIGGLADLSNYLLADLGQPTHFFSKAKVLGLNENISLDWKLESLTSQTNFQGLGQLKNTTLPAGMMVLKQSVEILAIPGISGSEKTKVDSVETQALVEIANFSAESIARASFDLSYRSDSSKIWAGGIQEILEITCLVRLLEYLPENAKIKVLLSKNQDENSENRNFLSSLENIFSKSQKVLEINLDYLAQRLDNRELDYWRDILVQKLELLGSYTSTGSNTGSLELMDFYGEINNSQDILEAVARLIGFENLELDHLNFSSDGEKNTQYNNWLEIKEMFVKYGFTEIISRPFVAQNQMNNPQSETKLLNPYNSSQPFLRDSFLPSLLNSLEKNILKGEKDIKLFEFGKLYFTGESKLFEETIVDGLIIAENPYLLTSMVQDFGEKIQKNANINPDLPDYISGFGEGYYYTFGEGIDASIIKINNLTKKKYNIPTSKSVWFVGFALDGLPTTLKKYKKYYNESEFPSISRTYSLIIPTNVSWKQVESFVVNSELEDVEIRPKPLERLKKDNQEILNFEVGFVSYSKTLDNNQITKWEERLFENLTKLGEIKPR